MKYFFIRLRDPSGAGWPKVSGSTANFGVCLYQLSPGQPDGVFTTRQGLKNLAAGIPIIIQGSFLSTANSTTCQQSSVTFNSHPVWPIPAQPEKPG